MPRQKAFPSKLLFQCSDITRTDNSSSDTKTKGVAKNGLGEEDMSVSDAVLRCALTRCIFYVLVQHKHTKDDKWSGHLGYMNFQICEPYPQALPEHSKFWIYVSEQEDNSMLYFEENKECNYFFINGSVDVQLMRVLGKHTIACAFLEDYRAETGQIVMSVWLTSKSLHSPEDNTLAIQHGQFVLLKHFFGMSPPKFSKNILEPYNAIDVVVESVKQYHSVKNENISVNVQHGDLVPTLRPYQRLAVEWMLQREGKICSSEECTTKENYLYGSIILEDKQEIFYHRFLGWLVLDEPPVHNSSMGGILADEMGLGKTVEVLACVLANARETVMQPEIMEPLGDIAEDIEPDISPPKKRKIVLDDIEESIEMTIAKVCHNGNRSKVSDREAAPRGSKKSALFELPNRSYEDELKSFSMASATSDKERKRKNQEFFALKFSQRSSFECVCGEAETEERLGKRKRKSITVQCTKCSLFQHANCVKYNVQDPHRGPYLCPHCWKEQEPIPSCATLIVAPSSICQQWVTEIQKCLRKETTLKIFTYQGVHVDGYIQPRTLASYDLVVMTYDTLRKELDYVNLPHSNSDSTRRFRNPKRFMAVSTPLTCVEWWRICLDEAQMVESPTAKTSEMALRLSAVYRWCVTGTPMQRSVNDLFGLVMFLGLDPFCIQDWWNKLLYWPFCKGKHSLLLKVIGSVMWRTAKKDVLDQICIPEQKEIVHSLNFSPVERHFYAREYEVCSQKMYDHLLGYDSDVLLEDLDKRTLASLLRPMLNLRQACVHPNVVRGCFIKMNKTNVSMDDVLKQLIKRTVTEAEEAQRAVIASLNGMAGIHLIQNEWPNAVDKYRQVLQSAQEHEKDIKTDSVQLLHAMHNLADVLEAKHDNIPPTLRDEKLRDDAQVLREKYLEKHETLVTNAFDAVESIKKQVEELEVSLEDSVWWAEIFQWANAKNRTDDLLLRIDEAFENANFDPKSRLSRSGIAATVQNKVSIEWDLLYEYRQDMLKEMKDLRKQDLQVLVEDAVPCHIRKDMDVLPEKLKSGKKNKRKQSCQVCRTHDTFEKLEAHLFHMSESRVLHEDIEEVQMHGELRRGHWGAGKSEVVFRALLALSKSQIQDPKIAKYGSIHVKMIDAMKKEFRLTRVLWRQLNDQVLALDELNMATTRMHLAAPGESTKRKTISALASRKDEPVRYVLQEYELLPQFEHMRTENITAKNQLAKKLGHLHYLQNLQTFKENSTSGTCPEVCPICQCEIGQQWAILSCGHLYCSDCLTSLVNHQRHNSFGTNFKVKCSVCRFATAQGEIEYVEMSENAEENQEEEKHWWQTGIEGNNFEPPTVLGSYSTKIEAIVRTILVILQCDPSAKSLVFSAWTSVLDILSVALTENGITFAVLQNRAKFQQNLANFKKQSGPSVLLMPLHIGANGLNLTEATNVLLVEPTLNLGQEQQAIGRIHRIGQTKASTVHRFVVRRTVEQRIHIVMGKRDVVQSPSKNRKRNRAKCDGETLTIGNLRELMKQEPVEQPV